MPTEPRPGDVFVETCAPWNAAVAMVYIPGGTFWMGSPDDEPGRDANEGPRHQVTVEPFWMGQCEVRANLVEIWLDEWHQATREQGRGLTPEAMRAVTEVPSSNPYAPFWISDRNDDPTTSARDNPVATMTAYGAQQFCRWLTLRTGHYYRLPTEAEWEYACRAGTTTAYYFGDSPANSGDHAWFGRPDKPHVGAQKKPNPWGLYDLYGNLGEYVLDGWSDDYRSEAAAAATRPVAHDPWRPHTNRNYAIARGGDHRSNPTRLRSAARQRIEQSQDLNNNSPIFSSLRGNGDLEATGFRIVSPLRREGDGRENCIPQPEYR
jgi:formylglycine-generating enzyme required for sulfatase activity